MCFAAVKVLGEGFEKLDMDEVGKRKAMFTLARYQNRNTSCIEENMCVTQHPGKWLQ